MFQSRKFLPPISITFTATLLLFIFFAGSVQANNGPHGSYTALTDACAGCHRTHTAAQAKLLIDAVPALCMSCHSTSAAGAQTNVDDGKFAGNGGDLLGGGFVNYKGGPATSSHSTDGSSKNAWGSGTTWTSQYDCAGCHNPASGLPWPGAPTWGISPNALPGYIGQNVTMPLTCTNCHDPHGGRNYRLLQQRLHPPTMQQDDPPGMVLVTSNEPGGQNPDQPGYSPNYTSPNYRLGLGDWCTGCHFTYHQEISVKPFNAEDGKGALTRYRHKMNVPITGGAYALTTSLPLEDPTGNGASADDQLFCGTCHYAHGTNVSVSGQAADVAPTNDSALLRIDNRGVCQDCHKK